jgi:hypothetical protein
MTLAFLNDLGSVLFRMLLLNIMVSMGAIILADNFRNLALRPSDAHDFVKSKRITILKYELPHGTYYQLL